MRRTTLLALATTIALAACGSRDAGTMPVPFDAVGAAGAMGVKSKPIEVNPTTLSFSTAAAQTFAVREAKYTGILKAENSNQNVAIVTPAEHNGPKATFTVTPTGGGRSTIRIRDSRGHSATIKISVSGAIIIIDGRQGQSAYGSSK